MSLIKQPYELRADKTTLKILLYGSPGAGKSTLALSMPKPVLFDADGGFMRISAQHRVPTLTIASYEEVLAAVDSPELAPFETIVIDTAGRLLDYVNAHIIAQNPRLGTSNGGLSMQGWGVRARVFGDLTKKISVMGKNIVFVAHEKEERDGDARIVRPDFGGGKAANDLIKDLDLIGYMEMSGKQRTVSFAPCDKFYAKNSARIDDVLFVPVLEQGAENTFMTDVIRKCVAAMNEQSEQVFDYHLLLRDWDKVLTQQVKNAKGLNKAYAAATTTTHIFDSKQKIWELLQARAKELNCAFDRASKTFKSSKTEEATEDTAEEAVNE